MNIVETKHSLEKNKKLFVDIISKTVGEADEGSTS